MCFNLKSLGGNGDWIGDNGWWWVH